MSQRGGKYLAKASEHRKKKRYGLVLAAVIVTLGVAVGGVLALLLQKDDLQGQWLYGATVYSFDGKGEGSMALPDESFPYTYDLTGDRLTIDFEDDRLSDPAYTWKMTENGLILADPTTGGSYELTRK